jgi:hypothetical protein
MYLYIVQDFENIGLLLLYLHKKTLHAVLKYTHVWHMLKTCIIAPVTWYMYVEVVQISASGAEDCGFESTPGYEVVGV